MFFDTPGIHESSDDFNVRINSVAERSIADADAVLRFVDASRPFGAEEAKIDALVGASGKPVVRVFSKWDAALPGVTAGNVRTLSSFERKGLVEAVHALLPFLPEGEPFYDEDYYTDQDTETRISEIIREKAFQLLQEEIPHDLYVRVEEIDEAEPLERPGRPVLADAALPMLKILAYLVVSRDSQKRIAIGKGAEKIREIATLARLDLESVFDRKVFLALRVKVEPHWKKNRKTVERLFR